MKSIKECLKMVKKWFADPLIRNTIILSTLFALIIHVLFSITAPCDFLEGEWGAGEILTYVSTIALGVLAVWQNQKFKEENDAAQTRMENLTNRANELSVVSKIIEYESERISSLKAKTQSFIDACHTEGIFDDLSDVANQPKDFMTTFVKMKMDSREKHIRLSTIELLSELGTYPDNSQTVALIKCLSEYSECAISIIKNTRELSVNEEAYNEKVSKEKFFITSIYDFIAERERLLNKVIYGNLSLEEIKAMYHREEKA